MSYLKKILVEISFRADSELIAKATRPRDIKRLIIGLPECIREIVIVERLGIKQRAKLE